MSVKKWSWFVLIICSIFQVVLFQTQSNIVAVGCVVFAWIIVSNIFLIKSTLEDYPLSTFLILGFVSTQFYFPLVFTLLEGKPVVYNLELPYDVFFHSVSALIVITISHTFYQIVFKGSSNRNNSLLKSLSIFEQPTEGQLWIMGSIGILSSYYVWMYSPTIGWSPTGEASDKAVQALVPFTYAPYFIPFSRLYCKKPYGTKGIVFKLAVFTIFVFLVSIARNSRAGFMIGFASVGFAYGLGILLDFYKPTFFSIKNFVIGIIVFWLFTGPIADIGTAMVIVRGQRHDITYSELIEATIEIFNDKEAIHSRRLIDTTEKQDWDEIYMDNIFIQRFSNLKFNDSSLILASKSGSNYNQMFEFTVDHFLATLPMPLLELLNINVNKNLINSNSYGDFFYYNLSGNPLALGGFRTGHFAGTGMAAFGWWYLVILGILMIPVFILQDKLCFKEAVYENNSILKSRVRFSMCGLLVLTSVFQFLAPAESVEGIAAYIFRGWPQLVLLYFLVFQFSKLFKKLY